MQPSLSPKKYIETKARSLPVYKCLVSSSWEKAGMADVVVMRQHVNGNLTGADFLVDLKCLGIKDCHWFFNDYSEDILAKFPDSYFEEIDYTLSHNIVYAGYEFALEFGIQPHKDFAVAKYILEEDTDAIPLIDIETGDAGIPHLIEHTPGQYADALLKLKKNAGEGNYHYTAAVGSHSRDVEADNNNDKEETSLYEIPNGRLNLQNIKEVPLEELTNKELVQRRSEADRLLCEVELTLRLYSYAANTDYEEPTFINEEWEQIPDEPVYSEGLNKKSYLEGIAAFLKLEESFTDPQASREKETAIVEQHLHQHKDNLLFLAMVYERVIFLRLPVNRPLLDEYLAAFAHLPMIQLLRATDSLLNPTGDAQWQPIIEATNLHRAFPQLHEAGAEEMLYFWCLQTVRHIRAGNLPLAVAYFELYSSVNNALAHTSIFLFLLNQIMPPLNEAVNAATEKIRKELEQKQLEA